MSQRQSNQHASWFQREQKENRAIMLAWWNRYVVSQDTENIDKLKSMFHGSNLPIDDLNMLFAGP